MMRTAMVIAVVSTVAQSVSAADLTTSARGVSYFHKEGATASSHDADLQDCRTLAGKMHQPIPPMNPAVESQGLAGLLVGSIIVSAQQTAADHKARAVNVENCMVVKGWQVVALTPGDATAFAALDKASKAGRAGEWIGSTELHGTVVRRFANDVASDDSSQMYVVARHPGVSISDDVVDPGLSKAPEKKPVTTIDPTIAPGRPESAKPPKPLKDEQLGGVPPGAGLIIVNVRGDAAATLLFERVGPDPDTDAWVDGQPSQVFVNPPAKAVAKAGARLGVTQVFSVPPGRWRLSAIGVGDVSVSFCLGSPAFDVAAGDAVYAGSSSSEHALPGMGLDIAKSAFPGLSSVPDKIRAATWTNGVRGKCVGTYLYALEIPDQPFVDGYILGSRAQPATTPIAAATPASATH